MTTIDELVKEAVAKYDALSPMLRLRHDYMQRRSFARGACPWKYDFEDWCAKIEAFLPHEQNLTDDEVRAKMEEIRK